MKILALEYEIPGTSQADYEKVAKAEARRVWELIPLKPYPGFARLFDNDKETGID